MLKTMLMDNTKAWEQFADSRYVLRHPPVDMIINSQELFITQARENVLNASASDKQGERKIALFTSALQVCKNINVSSKTVEETVLVSIRQQIAALLSAEELSDNIGLDTLKSRKKAAIEGMIETAFNFIQEHNSYLVKAYAHMTDGVISEDEYKLFREDFRRRISDAETNIAHMRKEIEQLSDDDKTRELVERFRVHGNITGLDRRTVVSLVHSIVVHSNKDMGIRLRYGNGLNDLSEYAAVQERAVV